MRINRVTVSCENCGKVVEVIKAREKTFRFCSMSCHGKFILGSPLNQSKITRRTGERHPHWKGGRMKQSNGYVRVLVGREYVLEHRHVMQQFLGRKLSKREQVHHKNQDKFDNRIENLELLDIAEHVRIHHKEGLYKPMGWSRKFRSCRFCYEDVKPHKARGLCGRCYRKAQALEINYKS